MTFEVSVLGKDALWSLQENPFAAPGILKQNLVLCLRELHTFWKATIVMLLYLSETEAWPWNTNDYAAGTSSDELDPVRRPLS